MLPWRGRREEKQGEEGREEEEEEEEKRRELYPEMFILMWHKVARRYMYVSKCIEEERVTHVILMWHN